MNPTNRTCLRAVFFFFLTILFAASAALAQMRSTKVAIVGKSPIHGQLNDDLEQAGVHLDDPFDLVDFTPGTLAGHDTIIFSQVCDIGKTLSPQLRKALVDWVKAGHKLIVHDADKCSEDNKPDYSFLPLSFETDNPGANGASGDELFFAEDNTLGTSDVADMDHFIDLPSWVQGDGGNNELGDSNIVKTQSQEWCGHMFGTNLKGVSGFSHMYAHLGKGLVIYDGFDIDQADNVNYKQTVRLELLQPFNPDKLPCAVKVAASFLVTADPKFRTQPMATGTTFTFPLKLYSNHGYRGNIKLSLGVAPAEPGLAGTFSPLTVALEKKATSTLTVKSATTAKMQNYSLQVTGTDEQGLQSSTNLALRIPDLTKKSGTLNILAPLQLAPSSRNIEIILDASGSMKEMLGGGASKIQTARKVLTDFLAKLPDDANVALRVYGHRLSSKDPNTCTDSELAVPLEKLDREKIATIVNKINPRGETPLVYSILKAQEDFGDTKAGSIVVVTDGEESCHGDTKTVGEKLKAAGFEFKLNIIGFGITEKPVQKELQVMAGSTGGQYFTATNSSALGAALLKVAGEKKTFAVYDAAGGEVARGTVGEPLTIAPGTYRVTVLGDEPVSLNRVAIAPGAAVQLKLVPVDEKWELQP